MKLLKEVAIQKILSLAGDLAKVDNYMVERRRLRFASISVRINLTQPLRSGYASERIGGIILVMVRV